METETFVFVYCWWMHEVWVWLMCIQHRWVLMDFKNVRGGQRKRDKTVNDTKIHDTTKACCRFFFFYFLFFFNLSFCNGIFAHIFFLFSFKTNIPYIGVINKKEMTIIDLTYVKWMSNLNWMERKLISLIKNIRLIKNKRLLFIFRSFGTYLCRSMLFPP